MKLIICDVDNVLSDDSWRIQFINRHHPDPAARYHDYHSACLLDDARNLELLNVPHDTHILLFTAMEERYARFREAWLQMNVVRYNLILYRREDDRRPSVEVKLDMLTRCERMGYDRREVVAAYDDRHDIVAAYAAAGLPAKRVFIHDQDYGS